MESATLSNKKNAKQYYGLSANDPLQVWLETGSCFLHKDFIEHRQMEENLQLVVTKCMYM